jgi:hypothetical protein
MSYVPSVASVSGLVSVVFVFIICLACPVLPLYLVSVVYFVLFVFIICRAQCCLCIWSRLCCVFCCGRQTKQNTQQRPETEATLGTLDIWWRQTQQRRDQIQRQHWARKTYDEDKQNKKHNRDETRYRGNTGYARHMMKTNRTGTRPDTEATLGT